MKPQFFLIGLGNPGTQYEATRHNVGWLAIDAAAKALHAGKFSEKQRFMSQIAEGDLDGIHCLLVKPMMFMNRSGEAVRKLVDFYKLDSATQILVCCDDIDLPLGTHRLRMSGGAGTHNGLKSIVDTLGENFPRLRIGLGPNPTETDLAAWILSVMTEEEKAALQKCLPALTETIRKVLKEFGQRARAGTETTK